MTRRTRYPELSPKERRRLAGKTAAKASPWRKGFNTPLSPRDVDWAERQAKWEKE